ncbi:terminase large subunit [Streptomyces sp. NPDC001792]|uniref:terminase large subunit domain-containing protein n=1 Tax=Streptomyces sp. NPDC001792 TaxID=3154524 RepID=UPI0033222AB6
MPPSSKSSSSGGKRASRAAGSWPPRFLTPVPAADVRRGDGPDVADFIETLCVVTKDTFAGPSGSPLLLRPWQHKLLGHVFARRADGRRRHRVALIGEPRKNGKSGLGAGVALDGLFEGSGAEVYSCAADKEQARIVFGDARRMVENSPDLSEAIKVYKDALEVPSTGSVYRCLSAEAFTKEGLSPTRVVFDELHAQPKPDLWNVMALAAGARLDPLLFAITTSGVKTDSTGKDSICYQLFQYGQKIAAGEEVDPSFFMAWWGAPDEADHRLAATWAMANPAFGDLIDPEDFEAAVKRTPEAEFRTKRLNQWVNTAEAWLPAGAWDACRGEQGLVEDGAEVCLGFDGSFNGDSTALVAVSCAEVPHVDVVESWEKPSDAGHDWTVPILEVEAAIRAACRRWNVREIVCDPYRWGRTYQVLEDEGLPVVEFPQSPARMIPATTRFYEAVMNRSLTHSGDPRLARHLSNCVVKTDSRGSRLSKDAKNSPRKIDLAVAAVMAHERACQEPEPEPTPQFWSWADL